MSNKTLCMLAVAALAFVVSACGDKKEIAGPSVSPTNSSSPANSPSVDPANRTNPTSSPPADAASSSNPVSSPSPGPSQAAVTPNPAASASASSTAAASPAGSHPKEHPQATPFANITPSSSPTPAPSAVSSAPTVSPTVGEAASGAATLKITATNWKFDQQRYEVSANKEITIDFKSAQGLHGLKIEGTSVNMKESGTAKVSLKPGEYKIYCIVLCGPNHGGMVSTIVAK